jgi:hypothetical protein
LTAAERETDGAIESRTELEPAVRIVERHGKAVRCARSLAYGACCGLSWADGGGREASLSGLEAPPFHRRRSARLKVPRGDARQAAIPPRHFHRSTLPLAASAPMQPAAGSGGW